MTQHHSNNSTKFIDSVFTPLSLVLISIVAIIAVAVALFQVNRGPVAPTAPQSIPQAAPFTSQTCALEFTVAGATVTPSITLTPSATPTGTLSPSPTPSDTPVPTNTNTPTNTPVVTAIVPTATPNPNADLSLTKQASNSTPKVGENIKYTVVVYNAGPATATNVTVYEPLVGGTTFVSATPSQGTYNVSTGIWTIGTIPANQNRTLEIVVTVNVAGAVTNTAQVETSDQPDPDSTPSNDNPDEDDQQSATVNPNQQGADLSLIKQVNTSTPVVGQEVTFTIKVHNAGPQQADNVSVKDLIPSGTTYVDAQPSQGSYNSSTGVWTIGTLTKDSTATMLLKVRVDSSSQIVNVAEVISSSQPDIDSTPNNNNPIEDDQDDAVLYPQGPAALPRSGNASNTTLFVIATGVIVLIIGAMGLLLLL